MTISSKGNVLAQLEFELAIYDFADLHVCKFAKEILRKIGSNIKEKKKCKKNKEKY